MIHLPEKWKKDWNVTEDNFENLFQVQGSVYRNIDGRRTIRFKYDNRWYFGKFHAGVGWRKILKNLLQFRRPPVLSAKNEWRAIQKLDSLGIGTTPLVGYGRKGINPAKIRSFVITEEISEAVSLEDYCRNWFDNPPPYSVKRRLVTEVARIARIMHENGMDHRDFYICHFLMETSEGGKQIDPDNIRLAVIDLHRVQIRPSIPWRWRVKDISGLFFSILDAGLTKRDLVRFAREYRKTTAKEAVMGERFFWWVVRRRAVRLYKKAFGTEPPVDV